MSESAKAVFLSYASQDAAAAQRICEALRAAGVEVWFDQSELRGGDAWDAKIRRQIKECALFVPIISASTQARAEGYFRLEWKLAVDRSHLMSDDHPFLFPVVIDDTPDATARVPDRFKDVQWTRLDLRDTPEMLAARVARLVRGVEDATPPARAEAPKKSGDRWMARAAMIFGLFCAAFFMTRPLWQNLGGRETSGTAPPKTPAVPAVAPASKAQQLVARARSLYEPWDFASADDLKLAERLLTEATEAEPSNAEGWAALAIASYGLNVFGYDRSEARDATLKAAAERAIKLAPKSDFARLAQALHYRRVPGMDEEALTLLQGLAERHGTDRFILRQLARVFSVLNRDAEALTWLQRAAALPGGDPIALAGQAAIFLRQRRLDEAEQMIEQAIAQRPDYAFAHITRLAVLFYERGDIERTRRALREIPPRLMTDERVASLVAFLWYYARDADAAGDALRYISHDFVESNVATMPKGLLAGLVHRLAGRPEAAAIEWRQALRVLVQRLQASPTSSGDFGDKAMMHALLGERAAAEEALRAFEQLRRIPSGRATAATWRIYAELGRATEVADFFAERFAATGPGVPQTHAALFRHSPELDPFRALPRFQELAREADRVLAPPAAGK